MVYFTRVLFFSCVFCLTLSFEGVSEEKSPLRVLMVTGKFPSVGHSFIYNQAAGLIDRGCEVLFYANKINKGPLVNDIFNQYNLSSKVHYSLKEIDLNKIDIVYFQFCWLACKRLGEFKKKKFKGGLITSYRGRDLTVDVSNNKRKSKLLKKEIDLHLPVCLYFKDMLVNLGFDPRKIQVMHSSLDLEKFQYRKVLPPKDGEIRVLSVARLVEKKGHKIALNAIANVVKKYPNFKYTIIGEGELRPDLERQIKSLELEQNVTLLGLQTIETVIEYLKKSHFFVLASQTAKNGDMEGVPNALKEAMAYGLPVISTLHAGIPELVKDGFSGFLVPENDDEALAEKIIYLIEHPEVWESMGLEGRNKVVSEYDREVANDMLYNMLAELKKRKSG